MFFICTLLIISVKLTFCLRFCDYSPNSSLLRVIGGTVTSASDYPWQAVLVSYDSAGTALICGATVLDKYWILTAAHCIINPTHKFILTGLTSLRNPQYTHSVERAVVHPDYNAEEISNDIALVKSKHSLFNDGVSSVCILRNDSELLSSTDQGIVTGFGLHIVSGSIYGVRMGVSDIMLKTSLPIIPHRKCQQKWQLLSRRTIVISEKQLCAGSEMRGTAPGDSGGPLLARDRNGRLVQLGITSFGVGGLAGILDQSTYPGIYTRVSSYVPWIESVINTGASFPAITALLYTLTLGLL